MPGVSLAEPEPQRLISGDVPLRRVDDAGMHVLAVHVQVQLVSGHGHGQPADTGHGSLSHRPAAQLVSGHHVKFVARASKTGPICQIWSRVTVSSMTRLSRMVWSLHAAAATTVTTVIAAAATAAACGTAVEMQPYRKYTPYSIVPRVQYTQ